MFKFGLTDEQIEQIENGNAIELTVPDLGANGRNATVVIEPADFDNLGEYANLADLSRSQRGN
jgi:hypothetical protein